MFLLLIPMFLPGTEIICQARGVPLPTITWTRSNGEKIGTIPGLRQVRLQVYLSSSDHRTNTVFIILGKGFYISKIQAPQSIHYLKLKKNKSFL